MEEIPSGRTANPSRRYRASVSREHLIVRDLRSQQVVAACLLCPPALARSSAGYPAERLFDLSMLEVLRDGMVEIGGPRIDPGCRPAAVMQQLWSSLARYLVENRHDHVLATVELPLDDGGHGAASAFRALADASLSPVDLRAVPRERLFTEALGGFASPEAPPSLRAYMDLGAWICGEPAIDREFGRAVIPVLLPLARMRGRYARQFLARAA